MHGCSMNMQPIRSRQGALHPCHHVSKCSVVCTSVFRHFLSVRMRCGSIMSGVISGPDLLFEHGLVLWTFGGGLLFELCLQFGHGTLIEAI